MLETKDNRSTTKFAFALATLSLFALVATAWVLANVRHEQTIVARLLSHLQGANRQVANDLLSELGLQRSLLILLVLNAVATAIAFWFVVRGYVSSERNLEDAKVLSADILASMDIGILTTDMNGKITSVNPKFRELVGMESDATVQSIYGLGPQHAPLGLIFEEMCKWHHHIRDRQYQTQQDGHCMTLRAGCTMLRNRAKEEIGMVIHVRDVTEKVLMEERLRRMERYIGLGSLAAGLQHEIKNPLNALSLHIQLLEERLQRETNDEEVNEMLDILNMEVKRIATVLDGFRNYASINEIGRSPVDVATLIEKLFRLLRPDAEQKQVTLQIHSPKSVSTIIQADAARLEQVLLNLALNAVSAMPQGGTLRFSLYDEEENMLRIDVSDTGHGIPPKIRSQIFDPYFTTRSDGTGMGLALCDKIIRQHDGSIDFQSSPSGTTFTILLPKSTNQG